ncbi:hypothetical protein [Caulobacter sp. 1776]
MDPYIQSTLVGLVFAVAAYGVFWLSMRNDRR